MSVGSVLQDFWDGVEAMIQAACDPTGVANYFKFLSGSSVDGTDVDSLLLTGINGIFSQLCIFGLCLSIVYCIIELNKKFAFEGNDLTLKSIFIPFLKLGIAIVVLAKGGTLIGKFLQYHDYLITQMGTWWSSGVTKEIQLGGIEDLGVLEGIIFSFVILLTWLIAKICNLIWRYKGLTYKMELVLRTAIAPVALADIYSGQNSTAIKYLKGFLATAFYAAMVVLIPKVGMAVGLSMITDPPDSGIIDTIGHTFQLALIPIAELGIMGTLKSLSREALGA